MIGNILMVALPLAAVVLSFYFVRRSAKNEGKLITEKEHAEKALERAKIAKDVRAGADLPDDFLHYRD